MNMPISLIPSWYHNNVHKKADLYKRETLFSNVEDMQKRHHFDDDDIASSSRLLGGFKGRKKG